HRGPVFVIMAPTRLTFLAAPTRSTPQRLLPTLLGLPLLASGVVEGIRFDGPFSVTLHCIGQRSMAQPPAPPITGADMDPHCPRNAPGRTGKAQQKGGQNPVRQRPLTLMESRIGQVMEGALAALAPGSCAPGARVLGARASILGALAARTWQRTVCRPERRKRGLT